MEIMTKNKIIIGLALLLVAVVFIFGIQQGKYLTAKAQDERRRQDLEQALTDVGIAIIALNPDGYIDTFSDSAAVMFGYAPNEMTGKRADVLMPDTFGAIHNRKYAEAVALSVGSDKQYDYVITECMAVKKDGSQIKVRSRITVAKGRAVARFSVIE